MAQTFPNGSKVRHKSGGPTMVVLGYGKYGMAATDDEYECQWWDDKQKGFNTATFPELVLEAVKEPSGPNAPSGSGSWMS